MKKTFLLFLLLCLPTLVSAGARRPIEAQNRVRHQPRLVSKCATCGGRHKTRPCHPANYVDPKIQGNLTAAVRDMKRSGIKPKITSAWRSSNKQAFLYNCSRSQKCRVRNPSIYYAKAPGSSLHEAGFAVDIDGVASGKRGAKRVTPKGRKIVRIMQNTASTGGMVLRIRRILKQTPNDMVIAQSRKQLKRRRRPANIRSLKTGRDNAKAW